MPRWSITLASLAVLIGLWEFFGRDINPVFGSYPSAITAAFTAKPRPSHKIKSGTSATSGIA